MLNVVYCPRKGESEVCQNGNFVLWFVIGQHLETYVSHSSSRPTILSVMVFASLSWTTSRVRRTRSSSCPLSEAMLRARLGSWRLRTESMLPCLVPSMACSLSATWNRSAPRAASGKRSVPSWRRGIPSTLFCRWSAKYTQIKRQKQSVLLIFLLRAVALRSVWLTLVVWTGQI